MSELMTPTRIQPKIDTTEAGSIVFYAHTPSQCCNGSPATTSVAPKQDSPAIVILVLLLVAGAAAWLFVPAWQSAQARQLQEQVQVLQQEKAQQQALINGAREALQCR